MYRKLFEPISLGSAAIPNRIVMPPMMTGFADIDGRATERTKRYYQSRAEGGAGLIIVEMACVTEDERGMYRQLSIWSDDYVPGLRSLTDAIHSGGAKTFIQLQHAGREARRSREGGTAVAPSSVPGGLREGIPRELTTDEIREIVRDFASAAIRARDAGFDGVEFHGAHIYLIWQFLSPLANKRQDGYGGSAEKRARFAVEILEETRRSVGSAYPVSFRINGADFIDGGITIGESTVTARLLEEAGATCIHVSAGTVGNAKSVPGRSEPEGCLVPLAAAVKAAVDLPVIAVGKIVDPVFADAILEQGKADLVAMGRALIADPELPNKARDGRLGEIVQCLGCKTCRNGEDGDIACAANAEAGRE